MNEKNSKAKEKLRFESELEFVQLLSNASYLNHLAQYKYFDDPAFVNYLKYLQYWKKPEYIKFIALQNKKFRDECKQRRFTQYITKQQGLHWQHKGKKKEQIGLTKIL